MSVISKNLTDRKTDKGHNKLQLHMEQTPLGVIEWSLDFRILNWNKAAEKIFGHTKKEAIGKNPVGIIFPKKSRTNSPDIRKEFLTKKGGTSFELECIRKNGKTIITEWHTTPLLGEEGKVIGAASLIQDISKRKQTEEKMYQLAAIVESTDAAIVGVSLDGRIKSWNNGAERIYGYSKSQAVGKKISLHMSKEKQREMQEILTRIKNGEDHIPPFETQRITKEGRTIDIFLTVSPTKDISGNIIGVSNIARDITQRVRAEKEVVEANRQLARSNRELQDFASVASHDLQEPLRKIQAFGDRLKTKYAPSLPDEAIDYITRMQNAANRMQLLINDLLSFARVTTKALPFEKTDLNKIVSDVLSDLEIRIADCKGKIVLRDLPVIEADPMQMRQLFQNLIGNGLKFHRENVIPTITIYPVADTYTTSRNHTTKYSQIVIEDNGIGFEEKYLDRIFNVFQRLHTNSEYTGTGVGLAVCRKIVERHSGTLTANSKPGKGSKFIVSLPTTHTIDSITQLNTDRENKKIYTILQ